jgi:hypothetical protein
MRPGPVWLLVLVAGLLAACRGDPQKCEAGCRNYGTLLYWKRADAEIARLPPATRDAARRRWVGQFNSELENGLDFCVSQCQSANNKDDLECMIAAKTADQAEGCFK